jgi:hypothetical protein
MKRPLAALFLLLALAGAAQAFGLGLGNRFSKLGAEGGNVTAIILSNSTIPSTASIGTTVGTLSVVGGTGTYTFTLTSNPGSLYAISGSSLNVAGALTAGSDPITIQASNGAGSVITQPFTITVTAPHQPLLSQTGVSILAQTGSPILVQ